MSRLLLLLALCVGQPASAEIYKWVDEDGGVHFGDAKPAGKQARELRIKSTPAPTSASPGAAGQPPRVTLYGTQWCGSCARARRHFDTNGIPYDDYDIDRSADARRRYDRLGGHGVPLILVGDRQLTGFSARRFEELYRADR